MHAGFPSILFNPNVFEEENNCRRYDDSGFGRDDIFDLPISYARTRHGKVHD